MSNFQGAPEDGGVHGDLSRSMGREAVQPDSSTAAEDGAGDSWFSRIGGPEHLPLQGEILQPARNLIDQRGRDFIGMEFGQVSSSEV